MFEQPPILRGSPAEQAQQLRSYLVRMVRDIQNLSNRDQIDERVTRLIAESGRSLSSAATADARKRASDLKSLIIKTADEVYEVMDRRVEELSGVYVAQSDFGEYTASMERTIEDTARSTVESYAYAEQIAATNEEIGRLETSITTINGQIRRGIITDPGTGNDVLGIAISEELDFTGETEEEGGVTYYRISPGQTFGLYTSKGWQFWINGAPAGYFSSLDGKLHVAEILAESSLQLGEDWIMTTDGGFGLRYIGGTS